MARRYDPLRYWSDRLEEGFDLRATGHWSYSEGYNRWLYRAKRRALRRALAGLEPPVLALDVGSGTGWAIGQLLAWGAEVEGCDLTELSVRRLRERHPDITFHRAAIGHDRLPRPDGSFDLVTALDVLYHVTDDAEWRSGVRELARVLRTGGRLVVTDALGATDVDAAEHVRLRSLERWREGAAAGGLELHATGPLYRWLSRPPDARGMGHLPDRVRGPLEYALERAVPRSPHMRWATFVKSA